MSICFITFGVHLLMQIKIKRFAVLKFCNFNIDLFMGLCCLHIIVFFRSHELSKLKISIKRELKG